MDRSRLALSAFSMHSAKVMVKGGEAVCPVGGIPGGAAIPAGFGPPACGDAPQPVLETSKADNMAHPIMIRFVFFMVFPGMAVDMDGRQFLTTTLVSWARVK